MFTNDNWKITVASVKGAVHEKSNAPNQDSYIQQIFSDNRFVFALADGHGSRKCFRSEAGSKLAVTIAAEVIEDVLNHFTLEDKLNAKLIKKDIPLKIIESWKTAIDKQLENCPITEEENGQLTPSEISVVEKNKYIVYGSTLIVSFFYDGYIICWQLGDGNILFVSDQGKSSMPMGKDTTMIANETYSLCMKSAEDYFNIKVFKDSDPMLRLILVSSDGYANSFRSEEGFLKVGTDILNIIDDEDFQVIEDELEEWLTGTMISGSGDDITAGVFFRQIMTSENSEDIQEIDESIVEEEKTEEIVQIEETKVDSD